MRLVKLPELKALPAGTLFAKLQQEWVFGDLEIKGDSFDGDFWVRSLNWIDAYDCGEAVNRLDAMALDSTISYPIEQAYRRNCDYNDESLYLVYEPDDVAFLAGELGLARDVDSGGPDRLTMENIALREMLEAATDQIHGEWGTGPRQDYDWLPEMEQHICGQKTGHQPMKREERHWTYGGQEYHCIETLCALCDAWVSREDLT